MDLDKALRDLIPENMIKRSETTLESLLGPIRNVLHQRRFPDAGFTDLQLEMFFKVLSSLDTDKDLEAARVGEREGRIASPYVGNLAAGFNHGIGRSGHVTAPQPKAPGASLMYQVANQVALDAFRKLGLGNVAAGLILPVSTGMSIGLSFAALRRLEKISGVLYPRIDHESPRRGIELVGLDLIETPTCLNMDTVEADVGALESALSSKKRYAVLATTTFFPPRASDPIKEIAKLCQEYGKPLVINNAYGVQSEKIMKSIYSAIDAGRVDAIIQSGDKNFLAPVGSSIIVSPNAELIDAVSETYAGRASAAPVLQTFAALLSLGRIRYEELRKEQVHCRSILQESIEEIASKTNQRVLDVENQIAVGMTIDDIDANSLGGRLYNRRVTGPRAIKAGSYGSCIEDYPHDYIVMNAAIGTSKKDIEKATTKLYKEITSHTKSA
ncbi:MAG: O-phosphoseryl-tRNA(Sec) selenium transferase [Candidatus Thorarchaeota archaeon]